MARKCPHIAFQPAAIAAARTANRAMINKIGPMAIPEFKEIRVCNSVTGSAHFWTMNEYRYRILGGFTRGTGTESDKTAAAAILQIGDLLQQGVERTLYKGGNSPDNVVMLPSHTSATTDVFSPSGGGITYPQTSFNAQPDVWYFGYATSWGNTYHLIALVQVSSSVCDQINSLVFGSAQAQPYVSNSLAELLGFVSFSPSASLPEPFASSTKGCFSNLEMYDSYASGSYFYQLLWETSADPSNSAQSLANPSEPAYSSTYAQINHGTNG